METIGRNLWVRGWQMPYEQHRGLGWFNLWQRYDSTTIRKPKCLTTCTTPASLESACSARC